MRLRNAALAACGVLGLACGAMAQETVKLEYKLRPGTELIYKVSGTHKMDFSGQITERTVSGLPRFVIADVDAATGVTLFGFFHATSWAIKANTAPQGDHSQDDNQFDYTSTGRMDRAGNPVARKAKDEAILPTRMAMEFRMFDIRRLDVVSLPAGAVAVGATWESDTVPYFPGTPAGMSCKFVSTLAEIKPMDGHKCAFIRSKLTVNGQVHGAEISDLDGSGEVETIFDVDGGFSRRVKSKLDLKIQQGVVESLEMTTVLDSMRQLPAEEFAGERKVIRALDAARAAIYEGDYAKAAETLQSLKPGETPKVWKRGVRWAVAEVKNFAQMGSPAEMQAASTARAQQLFSEAEKARADQKWADAVAKYKEFAEKYPEHSLAPAALVRAADVYETQMNDKKSAGEMRQAFATLLQKRFDAAQQDKADDPMELYKVGATFADGGESEKAIDAYRKFLAVENSKVPAKTRLLAQWRIGGLLEKQDKTAEAVEAYKAMAEMKGDDSYSTKLKEQAKKKLEALSAATPK